MDAQNAARPTDNPGKPFFYPSREMRAGYLDSRKNELDVLLAFAKGNVWKEVVVVANHVRGTGAMYGFENIGNAAEGLSKAIQNGDPKCLDFVHAYAGAVNVAYV
ncbi:MAG: hypothetical protein LBJ46_10165 [Planctomycetota bacterium]|jgi:uncharacterized protein (DUF779 family)|nr:hypothetical protein [Planctomycetota bacterium]